jgi:phosphoribosylanthranilate isomerase
MNSETTQSAPLEDQPVRIRVKICGITNPGDALDAIEAGADALGFNGFSGSKRVIDLRTAASWIAKLPPFVTRVAVLVEPSIAEAEAILACPGIDLLQFHGAETPEFCRHFAAHSFIKALPAKDRAGLERSQDYGAETVLIDAFVPGAFGGTGQLIDLELASKFVHEHRPMKVILSGGLTPENVAQAIRVVRPYAVDVASGVESHPRKKDKSLMNEFVRAVKEASEG